MAASGGGQRAREERHVANCVVRESSSGIVITKPDPTRKIDAALAAVGRDGA